jgi:dihydroorotase-like cyclic amidohydrolase
MSDNPPFGVPGLETTLPLMTLAAQEGRLSLERVIALLADNPRRIWGLNCPADTYALVDLDEAYVIERKNLLTQCGWSPLEGVRVVGKVRETWIRGIKVFDGESLTPNIKGRNLFGGVI